MNLVENITKTQLMTPAQAVGRYLLIDGTPIMSIDRLAQMRHKSRATGENHGPRYRKIGKSVYYEVASFDKYMEGELAG